jgi:thymidylate synthase (FAD)
MTDYIMKADRVLDDDYSFVGLVDSMPLPFMTGPRPSAHINPGDQRIVDAARVSIAGGGVRSTSDDAKLIRYLVKNRHTTPLEQVRFTFHVRLPIFVARQWIRHRTGSFNEESARYGKLASDFYIPTIERLMAGGQAKSNKQGSGAPLSRELAEDLQGGLRMHSENCYQRYEAALSHGLARELARMVLPTNIYTQWFWTTDLHNLMHFLKLRLHEHAQWETRRYAETIVPMAEALAPYAMKAFKDFVLAGE